MAYIRLSSRKVFDFTDITNNELDIEDIAHSLSNICRYTGHCKKFYSVAQHSVIVSQIVRPELAFQGLMHDCCEAFLGDVSSPLKNLPDMWGYKRLEAKVEQYVWGMFGLPYPLDKEVKWADLVALVTEQRDLLYDEIMLDIKPLKYKIKPVGPKKAYTMFMDRYQEIIQGKHIT